MSLLSVFRAITVRLLFACHGAISIWRLYVVTKDSRFWYLACALGLLLLEMTVTLGKKGGKEWKWFCPSVMIYLLSVVPSIWFLELHEMERRIAMRELTNTTFLFNDTKEEMSAVIGNALGFRFEIRLPIRMTSDEWIRTLEQMLLLILILGRWVLPKGKLTHDQLSQLLLVYIGTAADIVEFFEAFKEQEVRYNKLLCIVILGIWTLSLMQFTLVLTASRVRRDQSRLVAQLGGGGNSEGCCTADVYGIMISIFLQDAPFLVLRMLLIFKYRVLSYTNMFFTSKNTIVIILLVYRLVVVQIERYGKARDRTNGSDRFPYSLESKRLVDSMSLTSSISTNCSNFYDSRSKLVSNAILNRSNGCLLTPTTQRRREEKRRLARTYTLENLNTNI